MLSVVLLVQAAMICKYGTGCPFWLGNLERASSKVLSSNHLLDRCVTVCVCVYIYMYIYTYTYIYIYTHTVFIYLFIDLCILFIFSYFFTHRHIILYIYIHMYGEVCSLDSGKGENLPVRELVLESDLASISHESSAMNNFA